MQGGAPEVFLPLLKLEGCHRTVPDLKPPSSSEFSHVIYLKSDKRLVINKNIARFNSHYYICE
jgi:hypothetical protein